MPPYTQLIEAAYHRIQPFIYPTPLEYVPQLKEKGENVWLKLENWQLTGSFKIRGVMNKILSIPEPERRQKKFLAASTGNHAAAFAYTMQHFGLHGKVFLPATVSPAKLKAIQAQGVPYELYGQDSLETEIHTRRQAELEGAILVHPYNDLEIVAGQGTIGYEICQSHPDFDVVLIPVGGGGLAGGIAAYIKSIRPNVTIIGLQPSNSPEMKVSVDKGSILEESITQPTLSDGTAGGIEPGAITFDLCRTYLDDIILLEENEIAQGIRWAVETQQMLIEGAAGMTIAALFKLQDMLKGKKTIGILCGRRISAEKLRWVMG